MLVDDVLEGVHHGAVGQEGEGVQRVHILIFFRVFAEELVDILPGEELHAHGMGLCGLHAAAADLQGEFVVGDQVGVEGVARFMGHHIHIARRAVEVGQDKGLLIGGDLRAVAAAPLVFAGVHIEGVVFQHHINEVAGLGAHLVIHLSGRPEDLLLAALGLGVAAGDDHAIVVEAIGIDAQIPGIFQPQTGNRGHDGLQDIAAEDLYLRLAVAHPVHPVIAQLHEVPVAHLFGHPIPDLDHAVIDIVQLLRVPVHLRAKDLIGLPPGLPVVVLEIFCQRRPGKLFAPELKLQRRHIFGIFTDQLIFLDHVLHDHGRHGLGGHLKIAEIHRRQRLLQLRPEGGGQKCIAVFRVQAAHLGTDLVQIFLFLRIIFVRRVAAVADIAKVHRRAVPDPQGQIPLPQGQDLLCAFCRPDAVDNGAHLAAELLQRDMLIRHLLNFHRSAPPFHAAPL